MFDDDEDPFIAVWEGPTFEAEHIRLRLEDSHIPVEFADAIETGHARVVVPRSYLAEVRDVLEGTNAHWPELTVQTRESYTMKPAVRAAIFAIAFGLLLMIAFTIYRIWLF